jgi:GNAT superfamily N-acetyltransferase
LATVHTVSLTIRPAGPDDAEALRTLIAGMGYQAETADLRTRLLGLPENHAVYVAYAGTDGVGWVHVLISHSLITGGRAELGGLAVAPHAQGLGAGSALLLAAESWAGQRGVRTVYLRSGMEREGAHAFYLSRGYRAVKTQLALTKSLPPG